MRRQPLLWSKMSAYFVLGLVTVWVSGMPRASVAGAWPEVGVGNIPATVDKLAIAFDGWGVMGLIRGNTLAPLSCRAT